MCGENKKNPWEKPPDHLQAELGLSHMWTELGSKPQRWDDEGFGELKISGLNHSATGAADIQIHRTISKYTDPTAQRQTENR